MTRWCVAALEPTEIEAPCTLLPSSYPDATIAGVAGPCRQLTGCAGVEGRAGGWGGVGVGRGVGGEGSSRRAAGKTRADELPMSGRGRWPVSARRDMQAAAGPGGGPGRRAARAWAGGRRRVRSVCAAGACGGRRVLAEAGRRRGRAAGGASAGRRPVAGAGSVRAGGRGRWARAVGACGVWVRSAPIASRAI